MIIELWKITFYSKMEIQLNIWITVIRNCHRHKYILPHLRVYNINLSLNQNTPIRAHPVYTCQFSCHGRCHRDRRRCGAKTKDILGSVTGRGFEFSRIGGTDGKWLVQARFRRRSLATVPRRIPGHQGDITRWSSRRQSSGSTEKTRTSFLGEWNRFMVCRVIIHLLFHF